MNRELKFLLLLMLVLLAAVISLSLMSIMAAHRQILVAEKVHDFALSPDGEYIAFCNIEGLKMLSLKSKKQEWLLRFSPQLKLEKCPVHKIRWSPDMTCISFVREFFPHKHNELTILELATKRIHVIDRALGFGGIAWSPYKKKLIWIKEEGRVERQQPLVIFVERTFLVFGTLEDMLKNRIHFRILSEVKKRVFGYIQPQLIYSQDLTPNGQFVIFRGATALGIMRSDETNPKWLRPPERFPIHEVFTIPDSGWAVSPDSTTLAFGIGNFLWLYSLKNLETAPVKITLIGRPLEICWSPDGKGLLYVVSESKAPVAPGGAQTGPPHSLYWVDKEGKENRFILREEKGIRKLQWLKGRDVFYISGESLWKVTFPY